MNPHNPMNPTPRSNASLAEEFYRICKGYYHDQAVAMMADKLAERDALAPEMAEALAAFHPSRTKALGDLARAWENARAILARLQGNETTYPNPHLTQPIP